MNGPDPQQLYDRLEGVGSETTADGESTQPSVLQLPHSIPLLILNDGDTLLYIDPAPSASKSNPSIPLRVRSSTLLRTCSQYLAKFFEQSYQRRIRRKRGFVDSLPRGIKFLVDLTPAIVEEDAVIALTEISCPKGIRTWAAYQNVWKLPETCVGGVDELEMAQKRQTLLFGEQPEDYWNKQENYWHVGGNETFGQRGPDNKMLQSLVRNGLPVEYSASRHRDGIEWVLHVLEGLSIVLDTPCKMWTFFAIANIFEVATHPAIAGYILSWFYEDNNTRFIEIHPEISYRVACGIQSNVLCRHAFAGLVGDEAIVHLICSASLRPFGIWAPSFQKSRIHDLLSDSDIQRIEYASKAFTDDVLKHFLHLVGTDMVWLEEIPEFQKLMFHTSEFPKMGNWSTTCKDPERVTDATYPETNHYWHAFLPEDMIIRVMGRSFWRELTCQKFEIPEFTVANSHPINLSLIDIGHGLLPFNLEADVTIGPVKGELIKEKVAAFNIRAQERLKYVHERKKKSAPVQLTQGLRGIQPTDLLTIRPRVNAPRSVLHSPADGSVPIASEPAQFCPPEIVLPLRPANPANTDSHAQPSTPATDIPKDPATGNGTKSDEPFFNLHNFTQLAGIYISTYASSVLSTHEQVPLDRRATDHLTCLTDRQWKYLPLWAGGNDDGTGGVFNDQDIPNVSSSEFLGPGPAIRTSSGSTHSRSESFTHVEPSDYNSTVCGASRHATYSHRSDIQSMDEREWVTAGARFYQNGYTHRPGQGYKQVLLSELEHDNIVDYDYCPMTITYDGADESGDLRPGPTAQNSSNHIDASGDDHDMQDCDDDFEIL
ncbi:uncharacterized protein N7483_011744 [Penicillium malachiteum]|uniref:uncharacterized protein n=1 Tax=Penicillium malachiteum TaxID=1324776 RepID=UPI00254724CE|nr:uncharacterized protein N7483_011744 [Penicillium malachiteum]KAJ5714563.1 hypothetical protein N7483_011744 [Penicillium malachiteum]